jgi:hypothetical protein
MAASAAFSKVCDKITVRQAVEFNPILAQDDCCQHFAG